MLLGAWIWPAAGDGKEGLGLDWRERRDLGGSHGRMLLAGGAPAPEQARFGLHACPTPLHVYFTVYIRESRLGVATCVIWSWISYQLLMDSGRITLRRGEIMDFDCLECPIVACCYLCL